MPIHCTFCECRRRRVHWGKVTTTPGKIMQVFCYLTQMIVCIFPGLTERSVINLPYCTILLRDMIPRGQQPGSRSQHSSDGNSGEHFIGRHTSRVLFNI